MNDRVYEQGREVVEKVVQEDGLKLVEIQLPRFRSKQLVRVFIDKEGGVTLDDCKRISVRLGEIFDIEDFFPTRYTLEISSPGVDRPLTTVGDFRRNIGRTLHVLVSEQRDETKTYTGVLKTLQGEVAVIETAQGEMQIPLASIKKGHVQATF